MPSFVMDLPIFLQTFMVYFAVSSVFLATYSYSSNLLLPLCAIASSISRDHGISIDTEMSCPSGNEHIMSDPRPYGHLMFVSTL